MTEEPDRDARGPAGAEDPFAAPTGSSPAQSPVPQAPEPAPPKRHAAPPGGDAGPPPAPPCSPLDPTVREAAWSGARSPATAATQLRNDTPPTAAAALGSTAPADLVPTRVGSAPTRPAAPAASEPVPAGPTPVFAARYELIKELGRGGMGVVYHARDHRLGRDVALKVLLLGDRAAAEDLHRFQREVRSAAALSHPGIIRILDVGEEQGKPFYTMELVSGRDLAEAIRATEVAPREALEIMALLAEALDHAHAHHVLHRDIKPRNVILQRDGDRLAVKLLDFGLAKFAEREVQMPASEAHGRSLRTLTRSHALMGTPHYMSPEQTQDAAVVDGRADVYSLGASLYELLTGRPPFHDAASLTELLAQINDRDPEPPRRLVPDLDPDLETICLKCLAKDRHDRYATAAELAADCRRCLAGEPIAARPVGFCVRLWKKAKRNRKVALPLAAAAALLLAVAVYLAGGEVLRRVRLAGAVAEARAGLAAERFEVAREAAVRATRLAPGDASVQELVRDAEAGVTAAEGQRLLAAYRKARVEAEAAAAVYEQERQKAEKARTYADKRAMWDLGRAAREAARTCAAAFGQASVTCARAYGLSSRTRRAVEALADANWERFLQAEREGNEVDQVAFAAMCVGLAREKYEPLLQAPREVRTVFVLPASCGPSGASPAGPGAPPGEAVEAYLYRYELNGLPPVQVPIPYDREGRRLVGQAELGAALPVSLADAAAAGAAARPRSGAAVPTGSTSADGDALRRVRAARWGSAYVLRRTPANRVLLPITPPAPAAAPGTPAARPCLVFRATVPHGSYLLSFPAAAPGPAAGKLPGPGLYETRYPFEVTRLRTPDEVVELVAADDAPPRPPGMEVPAGPPAPAARGPSAPIESGPLFSAHPYWCFVPAGPFHASGDPGAQENPRREAALLRLPEDAAATAEPPAPRPPAPGSREPQTTDPASRAEGYFIARFEVTGAMYAEYVNDRTWHSADQAFPRVPRPASTASDQTIYWPRNAAGQYPIRGSWAEWPVIGISWQDATDYARWLTARTGGGTWVFALPTENEWEKAARGPDGRRHPWGDEFDPTFCRGQDSRGDEQKESGPEPYGLFPLDESPYGVRDLAGGMSEWTATTFGPRGEFCIFKGGNWCNPAAWCRGASRLGLDVHMVYAHTGARLVAHRVR